MIHHRYCKLETCEELWEILPRHSLTPTFSTSKIRDMFAIMQQCTDKMVENLRKCAKENDGRIENKEMFGNLSMEVICSSAFGVNINFQRVDILQGMLTAEIREDELRNGMTKGITRTEIVGNSIAVMMAGYEITTTAISILTYCIATEPEVQVKLYQEILETNRNYGSLTYEAINSRKYSDMCVKESLRLCGIAPRNARYTDVKVTVKGVTIPAGTHVAIPVQALHHDEAYWHEPWKFIPERFEDMSKIDPIVFQPFGAGPRICIGQRFAILEVKMAICKLLLNFELHTCEDTPKPPLQMTFRVSAQPKDDVYLKVKPRKIDAL